MQQTTVKEVIVEGRCRAEALVATKPLDYFVDEAVIQPSRLRTALTSIFRA